MKKQCCLCRVSHCHLEEEDAIMHCPINKFLHVIGRKWGMIVLLVLETPHRFGQLKKSLPEITEKMLITTLHDLEHACYISKEKITGKHLQSTYSITELGKKVLHIGEEMAELGKSL